MKIYILTGLMGLLTGACDKEEYAGPGDQPVYFEYHHVNHAWGFTEHGWLIDRDGNIRAFELPENFRAPDSDGYLELEDLEHNLGITDTVIGKVDIEELGRYIDYIPGAARGEIGDARSIAADAGASVLACYWYDPDKEAYQYVFLAQSGDWEQFNLSWEAGRLVKWLLEFDVFWLSQ